MGEEVNPDTQVAPETQSGEAVDALSEQTYLTSDGWEATGPMQADGKVVIRRPKANAPGSYDLARVFPGQFQQGPPTSPEPIKNNLEEASLTPEEEVKILKEVVAGLTAQVEDLTRLTHSLQENMLNRLNALEASQVQEEELELEPEPESDFFVGDTVRVFSNRLKFEDAVVKEVFTTESDRENMAPGWQQYYQPDKNYYRVTVGEGNKAVDKIVDEDILAAWQGNEVLQFPATPTERLQQTFNNTKNKLAQVKDNSGEKLSQVRDNLRTTGAWEITAQTTDPTEASEKYRQQEEKNKQKQKLKEKLRIKDRSKKARQRLFAPFTGAWAISKNWGATTADSIKDPITAQTEQPSGGAEPTPINNPTTPEQLSPPGRINEDIVSRLRDLGININDKFQIAGQDFSIVTEDPHYTDRPGLVILSNERGNLVALSPEEMDERLRAGEIKAENPRTIPV